MRDGTTALYSVGLTSGVRLGAGRQLPVPQRRRLRRLLARPLARQHLPLPGRQRPGRLWRLRRRLRRRRLLRLPRRAHAPLLHLRLRTHVLQLALQARIFRFARHLRERGERARKTPAKTLAHILSGTHLTSHVSPAAGVRHDRCPRDAHRRDRRGGDPPPPRGLGPARAPAARPCAPQPQAPHSAHMTSLLPAL